VSYTLVDGAGAPLPRRGGYGAWMFWLQGLPFVVLVALRAHAALDYARRNWQRAGGGLCVIPYGIVLWAMTRALSPCSGAAELR
jgi:hypothetical protein